MADTVDPTGDARAGGGRYRPTWESVSTHQVPDWFHDAKLGVFLHWGLYSVPGWAPRVPDVQTVLRERGPAYLLRNNPYAEWYRNTMLIDGSPTQRHHVETYGPDFGYDDFVEPFDTASADADLGALAALCRDAGARYVVLTTKHHDGFCLWPASQPHPRKGAYHARRDLVGDLSAAVREAGMRMGLYYSGGYDWPYNDAVIHRAADTVLAVPAGDYRDYATAHVRELIDRYQPSVLWNDICWPGGGNLAALFAHYYDTVDDGVVNDRWYEPDIPRNPAADLLVRGIGGLAQALWRLLPADRRGLRFRRPRHFDFETPEYATFDEIVSTKWEATRGIGHSFGANRHERPEDILTTTDLVRSFVDTVSTNGNLLIGIGPEPNGTVPEEQHAPLRGLGAWLGTNGEAIFGTRPWVRASAETTQGTPVRFTATPGRIYATLLESPGTTQFGLRHVDATNVDEVRVLGLDDAPAWSVHDGRLHVTLPERLPVSPALTLALGPATAIRPTAS